MGKLRQRTARIIAPSQSVEGLIHIIRGQKIEGITSPSPYSKRRIGYIIDED